MSQLIACGDGCQAPAVTTCRYIINGTARKWIRFPLLNGEEVSDFLCAKCFSKGIARLRPGVDLVTVCMHCFNELHQEAFGIVDCTKCANCCRTLRPVFSDEDTARIAGHLGMAPEELIAAYLERDEDEGHYRTKTTPCPFLGDDSKCTIYDVRPEKCRAYPFTDKPDFAFSSITHANNAVVCPAVFYLVEQMKKRVGRPG